jgi:hypothetical protein
MASRRREFGAPCRELPIARRDFDVHEYAPLNITVSYAGQTPVPKAARSPPTLFAFSCVPSLGSAVGTSDFAAGRLC